MHYLGVLLGDKLVAELGLEGSEADRVRYGSQVFAGNFFDTVVLALVGLLFGHLAETLLALLIVVMVRSFSGGAHASNSWVCMFISIGFYVVALAFTSLFHQALLPFFPYAWAFVAAGGYLLIFRYAPRELKEKPFRGPQHRRRLRILSLIAFPAASLAVYAMPTAYGKVLCLTALAWQALQVAPVASRWTAVFESLVLAKGGETG